MLRTGDADMADQSDVRRLALAQPEATEEPHFHLSSFRVQGKIFATVARDGGYSGQDHVSARSFSGGEGVRCASPAARRVGTKGAEKAAG